MEEDYVDNQPRHVADPASSVIKIIPYSEFDQMSGSSKLAILREKHILVHGYPGEPCNFDENALRKFHPMHETVSIQGMLLNSTTTSQLTPSSSLPDQSIPPEYDGRSVPVTVAGTVQQLLDNANKGTLGKVLNGLEFPRWNAPTAPLSFASDLVAWHHTVGTHNSQLNSVYPTGDMYWALAGTKDTMTFLHIDSNGVSTGIQVMCGKKVWGLYCQHSTSSSTRSSSALLDPDFLLDEVTPKSSYDVEAVVLRPNDLL